MTIAPINISAPSAFQISPILKRIVQFTGLHTSFDYLTAPEEQRAPIKALYQIHKVSVDFFRKCCNASVLQISLTSRNLMNFDIQVLKQRLFDEGAPKILWEGLGSPPALLFYQLHTSLTHISLAFGLYVQDIAIQNLAIHCKSYLITLNLQCCDLLTDASLLILSQCHNIRRIDISDCKAFTQNAFTYLAKMPKLSTLICEGCQATTDEGISFLESGDNSITDLNISSCVHLTHAAGAALQRLSLNRLNIDATVISDATIQDLSKSTTLKSLSIACTNISYRALISLYSNTTLTDLNLTYCPNLTPVDCLPVLEKLSSLQRLYLPTYFLQTASIKYWEEKLTQLTILKI